MANLDIRIRGLALCHFNETDGDWRIFFPKVADHDFKIIIEKIDDDGISDFREYLLPTATRIDLVPNEITNLSIPENEIATSINFFDLHEESLTLTSDLSKYAGLLTLHNCLLRSVFDSNVPLEIDIWDFRQPVDPPTPENPPTKVWVERKTVATEFLSGFVTNSDSSIDIEMRTDFEIDFNSSLSLKQEENIKYIVTFSNDCEGIACPSESDFKFFYDIVDESLLQTKRRFEMILVDPSAFKGRMGSPCGGITIPGGKLNIPDGV